MAKTGEKPTRVVKYYLPYCPFLFNTWALFFAMRFAYRRWSFYYPSGWSDVGWAFIIYSAGLVAGLAISVWLLYLGLRRQLRHDVTPDRITTIVFEPGQNLSSKPEYRTVEIAEIDGVEKVNRNQIQFRLKDDEKFLFNLQGLSKFRRRQVCEMINTHLRIPNLLRRADCEDAQPFQFSIHGLLIATSIGGVIFAGFRISQLAGIDPRIAAVLFAAVLGCTGFVMIITGTVGLVFRPMSKWASRFVNFGGMLLAAVLAIALLLSVLYYVMDAGVDAIKELNEPPSS